ncbi:MAG: cytidine deaminase [Raineya sp.]|jgi:cytidine deaminase|nr:cytidine deaminase [Raineya sp.]
MIEERQFITSYKFYASEEFLTESERKLIQKAKSISEKAYAPYSNFLVSACLQLENGEIVEGVNQENAAYPSGLCAERVAFFSAGVLYTDVKILQVAVVAKKRDGKYNFTPPCGSCRQVMLEFEQRQNSPIEILLMDAEGKVFKIPSIAQLLPFSFEASNLL